MLGVSASARASGVKVVALVVPRVVLVLGVVHQIGIVLG